VHSSCSANSTSRVICLLFRTTVTRSPSPNLISRAWP
jgi:hypothetical protein